VMTSNVWQCF